MRQLWLSCCSVCLTAKLGACCRYASEHLTAGKLQGRFNKWYENYRETYIDTGSPTPLYHLCGYGFIAAVSCSPRSLAQALQWRQRLSSVACVAVLGGSASGAWAGWCSCWPPAMCSALTACMHVQERRHLRHEQEAKLKGEHH